MEDTRSALLASLKTDLDNCNILEDELKQLSEAVLDLINKSEQELSFIAGIKCLDMIQESETYLNEICVNVQCSFLFQENTDIEKYLSKQSGLGKIFQKIVNPDQLITVKGKAEYNVKISRDSFTCFITGICCLASGQVIVADQRNKRVKLLNQQYEVIGHCEVSGTIWDLCHISCNKVAVTLGGQSHGVQLFYVNNAQLVNGGHFQLQHDVVGIAHHKGALYVTSRTALYQYTLTGILVNKLYQYEYANSVWKCALSPTGDKIHVNDYTRHKLLTLTRDGTLIYAFTDPELQLPYGVSCWTNSGLWRIIKNYYTIG
ncbi:uncharacterized protein LOC127868557 [Dreissena polymorpha]|uniref:Uncharacterized protein n=1 Tax=Dreissena polymorpha TaxID=45954 RepID=A0A9D4MJ22_DREPO|nr:uncharacterized protein LOC127868557 [Dreissena polymorpha]KAH3876237.1 hypothetical protein DPMN_000074 [Dreissena polymorpha]